MKRKIESIDEIQSASNWDSSILLLLNIKVRDRDKQYWIDDAGIINNDLIIPDWVDSTWLDKIDISKLDVKNNIKSLIRKVKNIYLSQSRLAEMHVDGFMSSLLTMLGFDDFPCLLYPQYEFNTKIGEHENEIAAKCDFSILTDTNKVLLVIEDKTMNNASYANNWREAQVMGELFVAAHNVAKNPDIELEYPFFVFAVRVVGTLFTFYKAIVTKEYIKESSKTEPVNNELIVLRHPNVEDNPSKLTAYNICNKDDRKNILKCMSAIRAYIVS